MHTDQSKISTAVSGHEEIKVDANDAYQQVVASESGMILWYLNVGTLFTCIVG